MRLIDADNLKIPNDAPYKASVKRVVAMQPTIEAKRVEYGKWVEFDLAGTSCQCTNCGFVVKCKPKENNMNYCPDCGADMRKKVD